MNPRDFSANMERFTGFGSLYDKARPSPPDALAERLQVAAGGNPLGLVIDLGSGTGLSTRYWARHAKTVIGIEPTASMREEAERHAVANIRYVEGFSHETGLPTGSANLVTCSQSLHWMEPEGTFREAARLLRPGGVFAANDFDWPPMTPHWEVNAAYNHCMELGKRLEREHGLEKPLQQWDKPGHLARMQESGQFRYTQECLLQHEDQGDADRLVNLFKSQGFVMTLLKKGLSEKDLEIDHLYETATRFFGTTSVRWFWSMRVRLAIK